MPLPDTRVPTFVVGRFLPKLTVTAEPARPRHVRFCEYLHLFTPRPERVATARAGVVKEGEVDQRDDERTDERPAENQHLMFTAHQRHVEHGKQHEIGDYADDQRDVVVGRRDLHLGVPDDANRRNAEVRLLGRRRRRRRGWLVVEDASGVAGGGCATSRDSRPRRARE